MKRSKPFYLILKYIVCSVFIVFFTNKISLSNEINFEIKGNNYTDSNAILSLLDVLPKTFDEEFTNEIIKTLNNSNLFLDVKVIFNNNKYTIIVKEYPNINKIKFQNNERLKDEDLELLVSELNIINYN